MRYKHLPIELKAAIKGGMNETSKQQVPGGALPWLNTKHVLTQKSWSSSHFPISRTFFLIFWKFILATNREEEPKLQEERHASPCPLYKGANKWILAPWQSQPLVYGHCGTSHGGEPQDHCRGNQGDTTALCKDPMLIEAHLEHHLLHSIQGQEELALQPHATHSWTLQKNLNSPNQVLQEPDPPLLIAWILDSLLNAPLPGGWDALAQTLHLSQQSKVWSHPHVLFSCHSPQKSHGTHQVSFKNFIFDKAAISKQGLGGQCGGGGVEMGCQKILVVL